MTKFILLCFENRSFFNKNKIIAKSNQNISKEINLLIIILNFLQKLHGIFPRFLDLNFLKIKLLNILSLLDLNHMILTKKISFFRKLIKIKLLILNTLLKPIFPLRIQQSIYLIYKFCVLFFNVMLCDWRYVLCSFSNV